MIKYDELFSKSVEYFKPSLKLLQQNAGILIISSIILVAVVAVAAAAAASAAAAAAVAARECL